MCLHYLTYQSSCCMLWSIEMNKIEGRDWGDRVHWEIEVGMFLLFTSVLLFSLSLQTEWLFKTSSTRKSNFQWLLICRPKKPFSELMVEYQNPLLDSTFKSQANKHKTFDNLLDCFQKGAFVFSLFILGNLLCYSLCRLTSFPLLTFSCCIIRYRLFFEAYRSSCTRVTGLKSAIESRNTDMLRYVTKFWAITPIEMWN